MYIFLFVSLFAFLGCSSMHFKTSVLEETKNESVASYVYCLRVMADGVSNVAGKNVSFCNDLSKQAVKSLKFSECVKALGDEKKEVCFSKSYN